VGGTCPVRLASDFTTTSCNAQLPPHDGNKIVVKWANKKQAAFAIEMTNQKITGVSIMIGKK